MYGHINIALFLKLLCMSSFDIKELDYEPDLCTLNGTGSMISQRRDFYVSELCQENGCLTKDSETFTNRLVNVDDLVSNIRSYSHCDACYNSQCRKDAFEIKDNLDEAVNPCDDFYQFACGGWLKRNTIPENESYVSVYSKLEDRISHQLKTLLEMATGTDPPYIRMAKEMYKSCMDEESLKKAGIEPLKKILKDLGGWPVTEGDSWDPESYDWIDHLIKLREKGLNHNILIGLSVVEDLQSVTGYLIKLDQPSLELGRERLFPSNTEEKFGYFDLVLKVARLLSANDNSSLESSSIFNPAYLDIAYKVEAMENSLKTMSSNSDHRIRHKIKVQRLMDEAKDVDWLKYLNGLVDARISKDDNLFIDDYFYIKYFSSYMRKADKRMVANYINWRVVHETLSLLSKEWRTLGQRPMDEPDVPEKQPRWKQCISSLMDNLAVAINTYYVKYHLDRETYYKVDHMFLTLRYVMASAILESEWMDVETSMTARNKVLNMGIHISYPTRLLNSRIAERYENLTLSNKSYFDKEMKVRKWSTDYSFSHLKTHPHSNTPLGFKRGPTDTFMEYTDGSSAKIIYNHDYNRIELPAGILREPFFNVDRPHSLNWGALGPMMAREMLRAVFGEGHSHDNVDWWSRYVVRTFNSFAFCFYMQYKKYTEDDYGLNLKVKSNETKIQNVYDNAGLNVAYEAYKEYIRNSKNKMYPWLKYTPNQLFWISAANVMCEKQTEEYLKQQFLGPYVPPKFRVIGAMSNSLQFSRDFNCPLNAPMNPEEKCRIL